MIDYPIVPEWWNGRRAGLKIRWGQPREGSSPSSGTKRIHYLVHSDSGFSGWCVCSLCAFHAQSAIDSPDVRRITGAFCKIVQNLN